MRGVRTKDLCYQYASSGFSLQNINIEIDEGEFVLVTGASGCGKSTLAYCLSGVIPHCIKSGEMRGEVIVNGKNTRDVELNKLVKDVGIVLQNPESQIFGTTIEEDITFGLENLCLSPNVIRDKVNEVLTFIGLEKVRGKNPYQLSGGEKQKLVIGSVLAMDPSILVLDEPVSNLDSFGAEVVLSTLVSLKNVGKTVVLIERRIEKVVSFVDRIIALDGGKVVADMSPRSFFKNRKLVEKLDVNPPQVVRLVYRLEESGVKMGDVPLTVEEFVRGLNGPYNKN